MISNFAIIFISLLIYIKADDSVLSNEFITNYFTDNDISPWVMSGNIIPSDHFFTQCGSQRILGGYKKFGGDPTLPTKLTRQYTGLIGHYSIRIQAKIYKIDSWNNQSLFLMIDNVAQKLYTFDQTNSTANICGNPYPTYDSINTNFNDSMIIVDFNVTHTRSTLDISFETNLNSDRGWWGLREIKITMFLCDKSCKTCVNSSSCLTCETAVTGLALVGAYCQCTTAGQIKQMISSCTVMPCVRCVPSCSVGYYSSAITGKCQACHPACAQCSGGSNTISPACNPCSVGYFRVNALAQPCYNCLGGCSACTALTSTSCYACKQGYFYSSGQCLTSCPNGTYSQEKLKQCLTCSASCFTCDGATSFHCKSCTGLLYLTNTNQCLASCSLPYYKYNNTCFDQCPLGAFQDVNLFICSPCPINCIECLSSTTCSKCTASYYLLANGCQSSCPSTHYASTTLGECLLCHADCLQCFGPSSTSCKICSDAGKILLNGACYATCPNGTYSATCLPCHQTCLECTGPLQNNCLSCSSPNFLDLTFNKCLQTCQTGTIVDKTNHTCRWCANNMVGYFHQCVPCSATCKTCYGTSYMQCITCNVDDQLYVSTCIHKDNKKQKTIKSQAKSLKTLTSLTLILAIIFALCIILQIFFTYKTALLPTIQFIQILAYFYFFSIPMSQSVQSILQLFYYTNFTANININFGIIAKDLPIKISLMNKTGYYAIDTFGIHITMIVVVIILVLLKKIRQISPIIDFIQQKLNPYLASYLYRLVILDQFFSLIIFLRYGGIDSTLGIISLVIVFVDVIIIGMTFFWKIKPVKQQNKEYALFYFNQIQQKYQIKQIQKLNQNQYKNQTNDQSSLLPFLFYVGKVPFPLAILYFITNGTYQSIAICGYSVFYLIMIIILPYKRKIYRFLYSFGSLLLVISSALFVIVNSNQNIAISLEITWLIYVISILLITGFQLVINYQLFIHFTKYLIRKTQHFLTQKTEVIESSVVYESHQSESEIGNQQFQKTQNQNNDLKYENKAALIMAEKGSNRNDPSKQEQIISNEDASVEQDQQQDFTDTQNARQYKKQNSGKQQEQQLHDYSGLYSSFNMDLVKKGRKQSDQDEINLGFDL